VEDMNQLIEYAMAKFRPQLRVETDFVTNACAFITAVSDNSTVAVPDREDRIIRKTLSFKVETYMPTRQYMIQSNGDITEMRYDMKVESDISFSGVEAPVRSILDTSGSETQILYPPSGI
tara:strand:+ start:143 stop:502 length:360 start_codon:yes stop_codon:yes gene_type:complete